MARFLALVVVAALVAAACGGGNEPQSESTATSPPATASTTDSREPAVETQPTRPASSSTPVDPDPDTTAPPTQPTAPPVAGGSDAGDAYFEGLGNTGYDALAYDLTITADPQRDDITASTTMTAIAQVGLSSFNLDLVGLEVTAVRLVSAASAEELSSAAGDAGDASHERVGAELVITPESPIAAGDLFAVTVEYQGVPMGVESPAWRDVVGWRDTGEFLYVVSEPTGAHGWYPVNDHPSDKATYTITVNVPEGIEAIANGVLTAMTEEPDGTVTWTYMARDPIASYLVTVGIGELVLSESRTEDGTILRDAYRPSVEARARPQVELQEEMLDVFGDLFGPYPFEVYGALVVDDDFGGALETQTLSVFSGGLFGGPFGEIVVAHELAHQWFGDSVTPSTWRDVWLNEGFATYAEWLWREASDPSFDIDARAEERARAGRSIWSPPGDPGPEGLFDSTVYQRGALTLHALRRTIGDDAFFDTLRTYTSTHANSNVSTADFIAVAESVSGQELDDLFDSWLYGDLTPELPSN